MTALANLLSEALRTATRPVASVADPACAPAELAAIADRVARALSAQQVLADEPVHVRIGNRPSDLGALLGVWNAGAVAVPVHVSAAPTTVAALSAATQARLLVDG